MSNEIKSIYNELLGYLSQAPSGNGDIYEKEVWEPYVQAHEKLKELTREDLSRFQLTVKNDSGDVWVNITSYRTKLNGLILYIRDKYLPELPMPFGGSPNMVITQNQHQSVKISILLEIQATIDKQLYQGNIGKEEKGFLEKVKEKLSTIKTVTELVSLIAKTAQDMGIGVETIAKLFS